MIPCFLIQENLNSLVSRADSECLNESDDHEFGNALSSGSSYLESDCDEQVRSWLCAYTIHSCVFPIVVPGWLYSQCTGYSK